MARAAAMTGSGRGWIGCLVLAACIGWLPNPAAGQGSTYVPGLDPAYHDLDVLVAAGLVRDVIVGERPYSRAAFHRFVSEARKRSAERTATPRSREALERLARRFAPPPDEGDRSDEGYEPASPARASSAGLDLVTARSPDRALRSGSGRDRKIDGTLNPLLQRNQGRALADGLTAAAEAAADLEAGPVAARLSPRAWLRLPRNGGDAGADATLLEAYGRAVVGPFALDLGRNHLSMGFGLDGGAFLSHNARALDMVRLGADRPVRLPGPLDALGLWQGSMVVADMGQNRDVPGSTLVLLRLSGRPSQHVEFGINYFNHQGGEGAPEADFHVRIHDLFFFWQDGGYFQISDKAAGADLRIAIPQVRSALYANFYTTDDRGRFQQPAGGYWEDAVWLAGVRVHELGDDGRTDVALEWRHAGAEPHGHGQFTSGITLDGRVLADPLGPNAAGVTARVDWTGPSSRVRVTAAWERYSGDDLRVRRIPGGGRWDLDWYTVADNPDEVRKRVTIDYLRFEGWRGLETAFRVGYEHVSRFDFTDESRHNLLARASLRYVR